MNEPQKDILAELYQQLNSKHENERAQLLSRIAEIEKTAEFDKDDVLSACSADSRLRIGRRVFGVAITAAAIILVVGTVFFLTARTGGGIAFADVVKHFERAESFSYTLTYKRPDGPDSVEYVLQSDSRTVSWENVQIFQVKTPDGKAGKKITLKLSGTGDGGRLPQEARTQRPGHPSGVKPANLQWVQALRRCVGRANRIGEKQLSGKDVVGFRVKENDRTYSLWAEKQTGMPVALEIESDTQPGINVFSDFVMNQSADESRFSTKPSSRNASSRIRRSETPETESDKRDGT